MATPLMAAPDEPEHVTRAAAVVRGEFLPSHRVVGSAYIVNVPRGIVSRSGFHLCFAFSHSIPASCAPNLHGGSHLVNTKSDAGRYYPPYYLMTGWPTLFSTNGTAVYLMRVASALICAGLLASAYASLAGLRDNKLPVLGLFAAITPMVVFLSSTVNPNSVEIVAGIGVWASGLALATADPGGDGTGALWRRLIVAASFLLLMRPLSPLWLALALVGIALVAGRGRLRAFAQQRAARIGAAIIVVLTVINAAWNKFGNPVHPTRKTPLTLPFMHILGHVLTRLRFRTVQMLGAFGWLDTPLPFVALAFWIGLLLMLFLLTCAGGSRRWRALTVGIAVVTLVLPVVLEVSQARWYGFPWQGRYILPFAVGLPIAAAFALREGGVLAVRLPPKLLVVGTVGVVIAQGGAFWWTLDRYQVGIGFGHNPLVGSWHPPITSGGALAFCGVGLVGYLLLGLMTARSTPDRRRTDPAIAQEAVLEL